nr:immunoglobulin heavy chain junction region [Mus musculus]MBK4185538.1 immunoglobulin heavy chain junction region [Mus musculus]MBK4185539.1 immunoglobulin heavy chain junction region [Mus musculus]
CARREAYDGYYVGYFDVW